MCVVWTDALVVVGCDVVVALAAALDLTVCSLLVAVVAVSYTHLTLPTKA